MTVETNSLAPDCIRGAQLNRPLTPLQHELLPAISVVSESAMLGHARTTPRHDNYFFRTTGSFRIITGLIALVCTAGCSPTPSNPPGIEQVSSSASSTGSHPGRTSQTPVAIQTSAGTRPSFAQQSCPSPSSEIMKKAPGTGKTVALTFDDGPGQATPQILSILKQAQVHATFFQTGLHATEHPDLVREVVAAGHLVADHTFEHKYPTAVRGGWTEAYVSSEISKTASILGKIANQPICFFRPPGGYTTNVIAAARKNGMTTVMWNLDSMDWKQPGTTSPDATAAIVKAATSNGSLSHINLLMHDSKASDEPEGVVSSYRGNTVAALPAIIKYYQEAGFSFVDLLGNT